MNKLKLDFEKNETTMMIENRSLRKEIEELILQVLECICKV